jgi:hypothetical protein
MAVPIILPQKNIFPLAFKAIHSFSRARPEEWGLGLFFLKQNNKNKFLKKVTLLLTR